MTKEAGRWTITEYMLIDEWGHKKPPFLKLVWKGAGYWMVINSDGLCLNRNLGWEVDRIETTDQKFLNRCMFAFYEAQALAEKVIAAHEANTEG